MSSLRDSARLALEALNTCQWDASGWQPVQQFYDDDKVSNARAALRAALSLPEPALTDEVIANLWHTNGGFHHHFARAIERWLRGQA